MALNVTFCPICKQTYDRNQKFCEEDGARLVTAPSAVTEERGSARSTPPQTNWASGAVGIVVGLIVAVGGVGIYSVLTNNPETQSPREQTPLTAASAERPVPLPAVEQIVTPTPEDNSEEKPSPEGDTEEALSPEPSPIASATPGPSPQATRLSSVGASPISTAVIKGGSNAAKISFNDGSSIEADDAWEDAKGVWYRRGSLVTFIEREHVNAVERLTTISEQTTEAEPTP